MPTTRSLYHGAVAVVLMTPVLIAPPARRTSSSNVDAQAVTLIKDGSPQIQLLTGSVSEPVAELQRYLKKITDVELPVAQPSPTAQGVFVGLIADFPWLGFADTGKLGGEGFVLKSDGANLLLLAEQAPGVQHAVTTFLQSLGCRWFFPGAAWEVVPRRRTIAGTWNQRCVPSFPTQRKIWYGFGAYPPCARDFNEWRRHNRMGGPIDISIGHTSHGLSFDADFDKHPEWFALVEGERKPTKPCYSHPAVVERAVSHALAQAGRGATMISTSPPDGLGYCQCARCFAVFQGAKPYAKHGSFFAERPDGVVVNVTSETLFRFVNQIAAAVAERYPQTLIGCYAYSAYSQPPSFQLHPNVFVQTTTAFRRTDLALEEQLNAWSSCTTQLGIRDYYSVYQWDWDYPTVDKLAPARLQEELRFFHREGVTSINAEASNNWAARGLGYYLAGQLMWDVDAHLPGLIRDFYEKAFGPAARVMERYYVRWYGPAAAVSTHVRQRAPTPKNDQPATQIGVETMRASFRDLDQAARLVRDLPECRVRVDQLRMYWHYLFLRHQLDGAEKTNNPHAILKAIEAELKFGGRLTYLNVIHTRPLLGKALLRRFKKFENLLANHPAVRKQGQGWRQVGQPPSADELELLWQRDLESMSLLSPN